MFPGVVVRPRYGTVSLSLISCFREAFLFFFTDIGSDLNGRPAAQHTLIGFGPPVFLL